MPDVTETSRLCGSRSNNRIWIVAKSWLEDVGIIQMVEGLNNFRDSREVAPVFLFYVRHTKINSPVLTSGIIWGQQNGRETQEFSLYEAYLSLTRFFECILCKALQNWSYIHIHLCMWCGLSGSLMVKWSDYQFRHFSIETLLHYDQQQHEKSLLLSRLMNR